jgi:WD40 repeat protein
LFSNRHILGAPFSPSLELKSRLFAVSHDARFVFSGGHWDWSLRVYSLIKSKIITSIVHHTDIITCLTLDSTGYILVTGSRDTTCVVWNLSSLNDDQYTNEQESNTLISPSIILYGHTDEITCVAVSIELDLVVSGSLDGTCNIHTVEHGIYIRTLRPISNDPIINLQLSNERHIIIQTEKTQTNLFLYSINGSLIRIKKLEYQIVDMILSDEYIVLAVNHMLSNKILNNKESINLVAARIIIKDMFE